MELSSGGYFFLLVGLKRNANISVHRILVLILLKWSNFEEMVILQKKNNELHLPEKSGLPL